jgi:hypothetical protein
MRVPKSEYLEMGLLVSKQYLLLIVNGNFGYALFPFNSARRLACYIQHYAVYFANFVSYAI